MLQISPTFTDPRLGPGDADSKASPSWFTLAQTTVGVWLHVAGMHIGAFIVVWPRSAALRLAV